MNRYVFVLVPALLMLPVRAKAQDTTAECLSECFERHMMCISTNDMLDCLGTIPSCTGLADNRRLVIQQFCEACAGAATHGCEAPDAGVPDAGRVGEGTVLAYESSPEDEPAETEAPPPPATTGSPTPDSDHHGRHHDRHPDTPPPPPPVRTAEQMCERAGGIWDPDYAVTQSIPPTASTPVTDSDAPHPGEEVHGVCWTREGEVLARRLRAESTARVEGDAHEAAERASDIASVRHDMDEVDHGLIEVNDHQNDYLDALLVRMVCHEHGGGTVPLSEFTSDDSRRSGIRRNAEHFGYRVEGDNIRCPAERTASPHTASSSSSHPHDPVGFRGSLMPGLGFQPVSTAQHDSPVPFYIMGELSLDLWVGGDWYIDGGFAFGYPFPDFHGAALEGLYHLGFIAIIENMVAVSFGGALQERYTDVFQSMHSIAGGYIEADYNLRRGGWQPYIGLRVVLGVGLRSAFDPVLDGSLFLMLGIAHLDSEDNNVHLPDCDTEYCRDTPIGRMQVPH